MAVITVAYDQEQAQKASTRQSYPDGRYTLRVNNKEWQAPKEAGKYGSLQVKCTILASFNGQNLEKTVVRWFRLHPKSIPYGICRFLQAAGIPYEMKQGQLVFDDDAVIGAITEVQLKTTDGERGPLEDWDNDRPVAGAHTAPVGAPVAQVPGNGSFGPPQGGWAPPQQLQQLQQPTAPQANYGMPQGGWTPPGAPTQQPPQQQYAPPVQQMPPQGYAPQMQPQYAPPQQPQYQQPPQAAPQNGGAPPWMQQGLAPPQAAPQGYPQGHIAGQGQPPPRGQG